MKILIGLLVMILAMTGAWQVAAVLSPDAVAMAVGMLFGVLAGIPTALLMLASNRRRHDDDDDYVADYPYNRRFTEEELATHDIKRQLTVTYHERSNTRVATRRAYRELPPYNSGRTIVDHENEGKL